MHKNKMALGATQKTVATLVDSNMFKAKMQIPTDMLTFLIGRVDTLEKLITHLYNNLLKENENNAYLNKDSIESIPIETKTINNSIFLPDSEPNKDGIPINTLLIGTSMGKPYILTVNKYNYNVGNTQYDTLSAAAEGVSGNRRSGWVFWKTADGRTAKEAFNNRG